MLMARLHHVGGRVAVVIGAHVAGARLLQVAGVVQLDADREMVKAGAAAVGTLPGMPRYFVERHNLVDLAGAIDRLLPAEDIYRHRHGRTGHGRDHVLPAFVSPSLSIPVLAGSLTLGTWQSVVLIDSNADNPVRTVRLSFLPG